MFHNGNADIHWRNSVQYMYTARLFKNEVEERKKERNINKP